MGLVKTMRAKVICNGKGVIILTQPSGVVQLLRDATIGMSPDQIKEATGIPIASWYRYRKGDIPRRNRGVVLSQLSKLGIPITDLVKVASEADQGSIDYEEMVRDVLAILPIPANARMRIMQMVRRELESADSRIAGSEHAA